MTVRGGAEAERDVLARHATCLEGVSGQPCTAGFDSTALNGIRRLPGDLRGPARAVQST